MKKSSVLVAVLLGLVGCTLPRPSVSSLNPLASAQSAASLIPKPVWDAAAQKNPELAMLTSFLYPASEEDPYSGVSETLTPWEDQTGYQVVLPLRRRGYKVREETWGTPSIITISNAPPPLPISTNAGPLRLLRGPNTGAVVP